MTGRYQKNNNNNYPEIFLALDNCFASKRYTDPHDWMNLIRDIGINYVEASADNECDPLYLGNDYLNRGVETVSAESAKTEFDKWSNNLKKKLLHCNSATVFLDVKQEHFLLPLIKYLMRS